MSVADDRRALGEHLAEDGAERKHVGAPIDRISPHVLGSHVAQLAFDPPRSGGARLRGCFRDPEVGKLNISLLSNHYIFGVHIPVHNTKWSIIFVFFAVCIGKSPANSGNNEHCQIGWYVLICFNMPVQKFFQVPTGNIFHSHEILLSNLSQVIGLHNIGVDEVSHQFCLANKIVTKFLNRRVFFADQFDCHNFPEPTNSSLGCLVDQSHSTLRNFTGQFVVNFIKNMLHSTIITVLIYAIVPCSKNSSSPTCNNLAIFNSVA